MNADPVIQVEKLGKRYTLGARSDERYVALRDVIANSARKLLRRRREPANRTADTEFWALQDVSFEVKRGEVVGIIGRNGAGKSTLLKILSRITEPTKGKVSIRGRVASLLEVGTGFHPELTGRENIFLNGAILGMHRAEIKAKFDEIVAFAEVERFLDTPVKRYSSGMYVRLAFAVAAHLEPEILIVDEVLAVGDSEFQKKCLGKMKNVAHEGGKTVLFVSHNMSAVQSLCSSAMSLRQGRLQQSDRTVREVVGEYLHGQTATDDAASWTNAGAEFENPYFKPLSFSLVEAASGMPTAHVGRTDDVRVQIEAEVGILDSALTVGYAIYHEEGSAIYWSYHTDTAPESWPKLAAGRCLLQSRLPTDWLNEGTYRLELIGGLSHRQWLFEPGVNAPSITVSVGGAMSQSPLWLSKRPGLLAPTQPWKNTA